MTCDDIVRHYNVLLFGEDGTVARDGRRITFLVMMLAVAVVASGCIFLDANRRNDFTGPSWDVDLVIPLVNDTYSLEGENGENLADLTKLHRERLGEFTIELPEQWNGDALNLAKLEDAVLDDSVPLDSVWAAIRDIENTFPFVSLSISAELHAKALAPEGVAGSIAVQFASEDGTETADLTIDVGQDVTVVDITPLLNKQPDVLQVNVVGGQLTKADGAAGTGELSLEFEAVLSLDVYIKNEQYRPDDPMRLYIDSDVQEQLKNFPVSDVQIIVDVEPLPFGVTLALEFTDGENDTDPAYLAVSVGVNEAGDDHGIQNNWQAVLEKLAGDEPYFQFVMAFADSDGPILFPSEFSVAAHMIIRADVNKR